MRDSSIVVSEKTEDLSNSFVPLLFLLPDCNSISQKEEKQSETEKFPKALFDREFSICFTWSTFVIVVVLKWIDDEEIGNFVDSNFHSFSTKKEQLLLFNNHYAITLFTILCNTIKCWTMSTVILKCFTILCTTIKCWTISIVILKCFPLDLWI